MKSHIFLFSLCIISTICETQKEKIKSFVKCAKSQVGKPFAFGSDGPDSFDIIGLAKYCAKKSSLDFPETRDHNEIVSKGVVVESPEPGDFGSTLIYKDLYHISYIIVEGGKKPKAVLGESGQSLKVGYPKTFLTKFFRLWENK